MIAHILPSWEEHVLLVLSILKLLRERFPGALRSADFPQVGLKHLCFHSLQLQRNRTETVCYVI